ncbi:MAG: hemolysin family protein [Pirellulaceae bacterium]|jgi:CBS domain containing-hemolysin-like protein|nr:hemolysin family protein [Pirellulaceae bacterium]
MSSWCVWCGVFGLALGGFAASGAKVLHEFSRRDLERYCRRRNRQGLFDEVLDRHAAVALAAESLELVGTLLVVFAATSWWCGYSPHATPDVRVPVTVAVVTVTLLMAVTIWIPWAVVQVWSAPFLYHTWSLWRGLARSLWPVTWAARACNVLAHRLAGQSAAAEDEEEAFEDEIRTIVSAGLRDGLLEADAREMIEGVIELADVDVSEIMTPRSDVDAIDLAMSWPDMLRFVTEVGRTRLPVYEGSLDNVVGILYVKDLLAELCQTAGTPRNALRPLLREPWFVPETKAVDDLLREFRRTRSHMAIVVDEYRAVAGVVTIEDALEEIVGEIADESDEEEEVDLIRIDASTIEVDGRVHVDELNEEFGLALPESEEFDTVAGLVIHAAGKIPGLGEVIQQEAIRFTVLKATPRRVERIRLELMQQPDR